MNLYRRKRRTVKGKYSGETICVEIKHPIATARDVSEAHPKCRECLGWRYVEFVETTLCCNSNSHCMGMEMRPDSYCEHHSDLKPVRVKERSDS